MDPEDLKLLRLKGIVGQLFEGKILLLKNGYGIAMGEDFSIGYCNEQGSEVFGDMSLKELNQVLDTNEIGITFKE